MSNQNDRVLMRKGARQLSEEEAGKVTGGLGTLTLCSIGINGKFDGDLNECG
jgi:hypothetical protein